MRPTVGAILFVLGACAPANDPLTMRTGTEERSFNRPVPSTEADPNDELAGEGDLERARRIAFGIFEIAAELCARSSKETADLPFASDPPSGHDQAFLDGPQAGCRYSLQIDPEGRPNAFIRGNRIRLTRGMIRFAKQDAELAFAVAHEVAHGLLDHGSSSFWKSRKSIEMEADRLGLELLARARYAVGPAADLLRRLADALPHTERPDTSYPSYGARAAAIQSIIRQMTQTQDGRDGGYQSSAVLQ